MCNVAGFYTLYLIIIAHWAGLIDFETRKSLCLMGFIWLHKTNEEYTILVWLD